MHYSRLKIIVNIFIIPLLFIGCTNQKHNEVLIFGTNTKVAFDVSADPANAGAPSFTLGYKRQELALVPLKQNDDNAGIERKYIGKDGERQDTYSVFASFGSKFSAGSKNGAALSQFFATGVAAQNLGNRESASNMVSIQPADAKLVEKQEAINALQKELGEEKVKKIELEQKNIVSEKQAKTGIIIIKLSKDDSSLDRVKLDKAIKDAKIKSTWSDSIPPNITPENFRNILLGHVDSDDVNALYEQLK